MEARILIISPIRNEAAHIEKVVRGVAGQDLAPALWIVSDDGSDDGTVEILRRLEREVPFLHVLEREEPEAAPVRDRLARAVAPINFNRALATAGDVSAYTHVMKLDGDIVLAREYLRELMERFAADPALGIASGVLEEPQPDGTRKPLMIARNHVHGALKCYSRECFERIGGIQERLGWDTIDQTYARMHGYKTYSFPDLVSVHLRQAGSADGRLRGHARHGECAYIAHYPPTWIALRSLRVARRRPAVLSGVAFAGGYARAALRRVDRVPDPEYRRFTRRELRRRMVSAVVRGAV